jgi:hypothetical protein
MRSPREREKNASARATDKRIALPTIPLARAAVPVVCLALSAGCTREQQSVAADPAPPSAAEVLQAGAADGQSPLAAAGRSKEGAPAGARRHVLPAGCVPPGKKFACNPLSNAGCDQAKGEACDDDTKGGFTCYPPPNEVEEGGECNDKEGPSCAAGMSCDTPGESNPDGVCRRLCCGGADCGRAQGKRCIPVDKEYGTFGFCK